MLSNRISASVVQEQDAPIPSGKCRCDSEPGAPILSPKQMALRPIPYQVGRVLFERHHYLHSISAGTLLIFGAFVGNRLLGAIQFSRGSTQAHRLVNGATANDVVTLARLWLSDALPSNSESRVIAVSLRLLRKHTPVKFVITYADPEAGHIGHIYKAGGWLYLGHSWGDDPINIGDGRLWPARTLSNRYGSSALAYLRQLHPKAERVSTLGKHKYLRFLYQSWSARLTVPVLPYPQE